MARWATRRGNPRIPARSLEIDPDLVVTYINWGATLYEKGQYQDAIEVYQEGTKVDPLVASLHYSLGLGIGTRKEDSGSGGRDGAGQEKIPIQTWARGKADFTTRSLITAATRSLSPGSPCLPLILTA